MCVRMNSCGWWSLRTGAIVAGVFTLLETLGLIICGGIFINQGLRTNDFGTTGWIRLPYRFEFIQAFGALYLAFGALWVICLMAYAAAVMVERALYILPWLILQAITLGLALANMISSVSIRDWDACWVIPLLFLFLFLYAVVFSYYMELQEQKLQDQKRFRY